MSGFTYETQNTKTQFETYEWDSTWLDHIDDENVTRVLYIGDSISCGIRTIATKLAKNEILFDGFGTSKSLDNPWFKDSIKLFAEQQGKRSAVLFNNGLHGWHLDDETEYRAHFEDMIEFLISHLKDTPIFIVLTTYINDGERLDRVIARNKAACDIAEKYDLPVIDLFSVSRDNASLLEDDGVHFMDEGYKILAERILSSLEIL